MKEQKKFDAGRIDVRLWTVVAILTAFVQSVESQSFSEGKTLFQLRESTCGLPIPSRVNVPRLIEQLTPNRPAEALSPVFLPRWSAEELPFFCRIEHGVAKKSVVPFKFRLGSVEYVDWLEGKGEYSSFRQ